VILHDSVEHILRQKGSQVHSISPHVTVYQALEKMVELDVGALDVMYGTEFVGLFSERDYVRKVILKGISS
jgi:CBS domain-containing protein